MTDEGLIALGRYCKSLTVIEVAENDLVTADGFEGLAKVPALQHIVVLHCKRFSDRAMAGFSRHPVSYLNLSDNSTITDGGMRILGQGAGPGAAARQALRTLILHNIFRVTDTGVRYLARGCTDIQHLDVSGCTRLTDASISAIINCLPNLYRLCLEGGCVNSDGQHERGRKPEQG